ncbi:hypothetical protein IGI04_009640 [Brassica rapa subsp. trilocularis]|uniref:Transmembrane protein n=1 Tax=Brassica rapa subsp. trilocularis TaxID=1813537 RepID=A0ABQ7N079_BRACM|nr:hypothetical protein IGI04_009640 [Brassica rapa subsp. trilocularis]
MAYQANFDTTPASSVAPRPWWSRPMMTVPPISERKSTCKEMAVMCAPCCGGFFTIVLVFLIFSSINDAHFHAKISLQSFAVSSATWQGDFLVKIPSSRYSICYDGDDASVTLGLRNVAVLNITSRRVSRDHTAFSLSFVAEEGNRSDVVSEDLDIKLVAKHKRYEDYDKAGEFNIRCQNLTRGREKIICDSSFTDLKLFSLITLRGYCCATYLCTIIFILVITLISGGMVLFDHLVLGKSACYIELFAHSVSVSNVTNAANVSTADWRTGLVAKSPVTRCKLSLHTVTSRLLRGDEVISQVSPSLDDFGRLVTTEKNDEPVTIVDFKHAVTSGVNGSVVWDYRVESVVGLKAEFAHGFLSVICSGIPVKFTTDAAGNVFGSLLGGMRRCGYSLRDNLNSV